LFELSTLLTFPWIAIIVIPIEIASSLVANYVIVKKTDVNQLRVATIEYQSFMKEYRQAVMQKDQAKVDKLREEDEERSGPLHESSEREDEGKLLLPLSFNTDLLCSCLCCRLQNPCCSISLQDTCASSTSASIHRGAYTISFRLRNAFIHMVLSHIHCNKSSDKQADGDYVGPID